MLNLLMYLIVFWNDNFDAYIAYNITIFFWQPIVNTYILEYGSIYMCNYLIHQLLATKLYAWIISSANKLQIGEEFKVALIVDQIQLQTIRMYETEKTTIIKEMVIQIQ